ncbi:MAG: putative toxin-antitoxin system toxin component, PIN family [Rhodocyclales bacterium]|nr:putative toxin-antitoxin system toxin component, PIN family [Rhodocyclales bacterium]
MPPQTLVLDTNTVMALWVFEDPALHALRQSVEAGSVTLATRADALEELRHVLAYRQFGLDPARQAALHAEYVALCSIIVADTATPAALPACRDRDDQKFLEIARDARATHLVSRDKALLRLNRHRLVRALFAIVKPEAFPAADADDDTRAMANP